MDRQDKLGRFEEVISPHFGSAYNLSRWLTGNRADAEDVVQEAFLRAFASFHAFHGENGKPWLLAIVRNTAATWAKRRQNFTVTDVDLDHHAAHEPDPEALLKSECERDRVRQALAQLVPEYRETIVLREFEGCSYKDIAAIVGVPLGTVMSRLARGREYLRQLLAPMQEKTDDL